jgi:tetratricopeptide (TPR) repeat protein
MIDIAIVEEVERNMCNNFNLGGMVKQRLAWVLVMGTALFLLIGCQSQYITAGKIYIEQSNYDAAIEQFKLAIQAEPNNPEAYIWLGKAYAHKKKYDEACKQTEKAIEIDPSRIDVLKNDQSFNYWAVYYNAGMKHVENKEYEKAVPRIQRSLDFDNKNALSYNLLAFCYMKLKKDDEAEKTYKKAIEIVPNNVESYLNLSTFYRKDNKLEEEHEVLVRARKIVEKPEWLKAADEETIKKRKLAAASVYIDLGNNLLKQEKPGEAEAILSKAIGLSPEDKDVNFNYGLALVGMDKFAEALKPFTKVVELDSTDKGGFYYLGYVYLKLERYNDAIDAFTHAIAIDPDYCEAYINRAFAHRELGDKNKAYDDAKAGTECKEKKGEK